MSDRKEDRQYTWYVCGKCKHENYRLKTEDSDDCTECGAVMAPPTGIVANYLLNGDMEDWTAGSPDSWTLSGAGATVAQETTIIKAGTYSAKLTRVGTDCYLYQQIHATEGVNWWKGGTYEFGAWVYCTTADVASIVVYDGVDTTQSDLHGGTGWEYLHIAHKVSLSATEVTIRLQIEDTNASAYFDEICQKQAIDGGEQIELRQWDKRERGVDDIPNEIKLDLNNPNG